MTSLKYLSLQVNHIKRLPLALGDMNTLTRLKVEANPIEFPPPEVFRPKQNQGMGSDLAEVMDVCVNVKRFLKAASLRQRILTPKEEDARYAVYVMKPFN